MNGLKSPLNLSIFLHTQEQLLGQETSHKCLVFKYVNFDPPNKIVHNLSQAMDIDASLARLEERSRHVQINDESLCDSCHARLGTKLFAMYPDDTIVCYKCFRRQGESISVTGRNFKRDTMFKPGWLVTR
ncbi:hypothetical protein F0562_019492 [Nyssa sinensis]|uniref:Vacuolar sorting protein 39/Transforming growth factor beta receptor-associated zinc finger domain-containing protein n=1 Tax=Nyssa sinensis TaxID=561372 RepID=A0A5J5BTS2_9ASTE|nr:hypothetical protein F0562_019492 [Nyssa sinensis]